MDSDEILMSLSFSPSSLYLLVGVRSSKIFGCFLKIIKNRRRNKISPPICINYEDTKEEKDIEMEPFENNGKLQLPNEQLDEL